MGPTFTLFYKPYSRPRYVEFFSDQPRNALGVKDAPCISWSESSVWIRKSLVAAFSVSIFSRYISHVVQIAANVKMLRVYTTRIIAGVQNEHSCWDSFFPAFVSEPMGSDVLSIKPEKVSIAAAVRRAYPFPAFFSAIRRAKIKVAKFTAKSAPAVTAKNFFTANNTEMSLSHRAGIQP